MERLTEDYNDSYCLKKCHPNNDCFCDGGGCPIDNCREVIEALNKLGEYEQLEEQGLLVRLPCKVGDSLYCIAEGTVKKLKACSFIISGSGIIDIDLEYEDAFCCIRYIKRFGENVFLTREEAEKKLEEMKNGL